MFFDGNVVRSGHLVILSYMVPLSIISGHYEVISKKHRFDPVFAYSGGILN